MEQKTINESIIRKWEDENGYSIEITIGKVSKHYIKVKKMSIVQEEYNGQKLNILTITDSMGDEYELQNYANPSEFDLELNSYDEDDIKTVRKGSVVAFRSDEENCKLVMGFSSNYLDRLNKKHFS